MVSATCTVQSGDVVPVVGVGVAGVAMGPQRIRCPCDPMACPCRVAMRRPVPAVLVALAAAALGAVILGEHVLGGPRPILAGFLFGVTVAEVLATLARPWARRPELWAAGA